MGFVPSAKTTTLLLGGELVWLTDLCRKQIALDLTFGSDTE